MIAELRRGRTLQCKTLEKVCEVLLALVSATVSLCALYFLFAVGEVEAAVKAELGEETGLVEEDLVAVSYMGDELDLETVGDIIAIIEEKVRTWAETTVFFYVNRVVFSSFMSPKKIDLQIQLQSTWNFVLNINKNNAMIRKSCSTCI